MDKIACDTLEMLVEQIKKINKKGDISPAELDSLHKAYSLRQLITCGGEGGYDGEKMSGYYMPDPERMSGYRMPHMRVSYGRPYYDGYDDGDSLGRGRSPVTGRYISRDGTHMYEANVSGHSIKDRMIARLETMYDEAKSEHERQVITEEIRRLESEK